MASVQGWGRETWGSGAWNQFAPVEATGVGLTSSTTSPTITGSCSVTLTSAGDTTSFTGTAVGTGGQTLTAPTLPVLQSNTNDVTSVVGSATVTPSGRSATSAIGSESIATGAQSGWNRAFDGSTGTAIGWGNNEWGTLNTAYALTGVVATSNTGTMGFVGSVSITPSGRQATATTGTLGTSIFVTGVQGTSSIGTFSITADATITVVAASEPELDASVGTVVVAISPTVLPAGQAMTSSIGAIGFVGSVNVTPTGQPSTSAIGAPTITGTSTVTLSGRQATSSTGTMGFVASVNVTPTGQIATSAIGQATQVSSYAVTGVQGTTSLGTVNISGSSVFTVTGVSATISVSTPFVTGWKIVDDSNSAISWSEVTKAA
jgi:hypothetical protein